MASHSENERQRETDRKREGLGVRVTQVRERDDRRRETERAEREKKREMVKREWLGKKCLLAAIKAASKICTKCLPSKSSKCEKNERQRKPFFVQLKRSARSFLNKSELSQDQGQTDQRP